MHKRSYLVLVGLFLLTVSLGLVAEENETMSTTDLEKSEAAMFSELDALTEKVFGEGNFRIPTDYTRGRINISVMETIFHCFYHESGMAINEKAKELQKAFSKLIADKDYLGTVRWSTGYTAQVKTRFRLAHFIFDNVLAY